MTIFGKSCPGFFWGPELMMFDFLGRGAVNIQPEDANESAYFNEISK